MNRRPNEPSRSNAGVGSSASTLLDLKAELLKKQTEFEQQRQQRQSNLQTTSTSGVNIVNKSSKFLSNNKEIVEKAFKDRKSGIKVTDKDYEDWEKSRKALEAKAKIYEQMQSGEYDYEGKEQTETEVDGFVLSKAQQENIMVDFVRKEPEARQEKRALRNVDEDDRDDIPILKTKQARFSSTENSNNQESDDYIEIIDEFGRSVFVKKSEHERTNNHRNDNNFEKDTSRSLRENRISFQPESEMDRYHSKSQPLHYDSQAEVRPRGIGFYSLSLDETERQRQLSELKKLRENTTEQRERYKLIKEERRLLLDLRLQRVKERREKIKRESEEI